MLSSTGQLAAFIVTLGAIALAVAAAAWAFYMSRNARSANAGWRSRAEQLEHAVDRADTLLAAHPGVLFAWEEDTSGGPSGWGSPAMYGAPASIASLLRFAEAHSGDAPLEARVLDGMADYDATDAAGETTTLRKALTRLNADGAPFSLVIHGPGGRTLEVDGRPAGSRIALWVADPNLKVSEYLSTAGRADEAGKRIFDDPAAFQDLLERMPLPAWRYSSGMKLIWANAAFLNVVEASNLRDAQVRDLALDERSKEQARRSIEEGVVGESREITAVGAQRLVDILTFPISGGVAGVAVDMTPLARQRNQARDASDWRGSALNRVADAVAIFSPDRELVFHNAAFARLFDLNQDWLKRAPTHGDLLDRLHEEGKTPMTADYAAWRAGEMAMYARGEEPLPDGVWELGESVRLRVVRVRHPAGGGVVVFRDETELYRLKTDLKTRMSVQLATLDKLGDALAVFGNDGRCQLQNAAFSTLWELPDRLTEDGAAFGDIMESSLPLFADRQSWLRMKARITNISEDVRKEVTEYIERTDGKILRLVSRPLPDGATALSFTDVTADRHLEQALRERNDALQSVEKVQSDFVGHVSYQLRAPLQTIMGYAELLKMTLDPEANPRESDQADIIARASGELNKLVDNILDVAAITSNAVDMEWADVPLADALQDAIQLVQTKAEDTRIKLVVDCPLDIGAIRADARRLKQVVYNLLVNAVRHTPPGGQVIVGARRDRGGVVVWVADDGAGIPADQRAHIFDPFTSGDHGGAGLGLTLVKAFVNLHGGWVDVESEEGEGTRVTCHFPVPDEGEDAIAAE